jgi:hypothetical protein
VLPKNIKPEDIEMLKAMHGKLQRANEAAEQFIRDIKVTPNADLRRVRPLQNWCSF